MKVASRLIYGTRRKVKQLPSIETTQGLDTQPPLHSSFPSALNSASATFAVYGKYKAAHHKEGLLVLFESVRMQKPFYMNFPLGLAYSNQNH